MKLNYKLNEAKNGLIVTGGEDLVGDVIIPSQAEMDAKTYPVTEIGEYAFNRCEGMKSIVIPNSVTKIGVRAFNHCEYLHSIDFPDSVTEIWQTLYELLIPESMVSIDKSAFPRCSANVYVMTPVYTPEEERGLLTHLMNMHGAQNPAQKAAMLLNAIEKGSQESNGGAPKRELVRRLWLAKDEFSQFPWGEYRKIVSGLDTGLVKRDRIPYSVGRWAEENFVGTTMCGAPWNGVVFYASMEEPDPRKCGRYYEGERI